MRHKLLHDGDAAPSSRQMVGLELCAQNQANMVSRPSKQDLLRQIPCFHPFNR